MLETRKSASNEDEYSNNSFDLNSTKSLDPGDLTEAHVNTTDHISSGNTLGKI